MGDLVKNPEEIDLESLDIGGIPDWAKRGDPEPTVIEGQEVMAPWEAPLTENQIDTLQKQPEPDESTATIRSNQFLRNFGVLSQTVNTVREALKDKLEIKDDRGFIAKGKLDWKDAQDQSAELNLWKVPLIGQPMTPEEKVDWQKQVDEKNEKIRSRDRTRNILGEIGYAAMQQIPIYLGGAKKGWKLGATLGVMVGGVVSAGGATAPAGIYASLKAGMIGIQMGITEEMMEVMAASMYKQLTLSPEYSKLPEDWKKAASFSYGISAGLVEMFQMRAIGKPFNARIKARYAKVLGDSVDNAVKPTGVVPSYLKTAGEELGEEVIQSGLEIGIKDMVGRLWNEFGGDPDVKITRETWNTIANKFMQDAMIMAPTTMLMTALLGAPPMAILISEVGKARNAQPEYIRGLDSTVLKAQQTANEILDRTERGEPIIDTNAPPPEPLTVAQMQEDSGATLFDPADPAIYSELASPVVDEQVPMETRMGDITAEQLATFAETAGERIMAEPEIEGQTPEQEAAAKKRAADLVISTNTLLKAVREIEQTKLGIDERDISWMQRQKMWLGDNFLSPLRFLDSLEGGKAFQGKLLKMFWRDYNVLDTNQYNMKTVMEEETRSMYEGLKIKGKKLTNVRMKLDTMKIMINGEPNTMTLAGLGDLWASQFDADKRAAALDGIYEGSEANYQEALSQVPKDVRTIAERTIAWYQKWYPVLDGVYFNVTGKHLENIPGYTPIVRDRYVTTGYDSDLVNETKYRGVVRETALLPSETIARVHNLDPETQQRLLPKLDLTGTQERMMQTMSHFITKGEYLQKMEGVYAAIETPLRKKVGSVRQSWLGEYINTLKHPELAYGVDAGEQFFRRMRQNATLGILSANLGLVMKQGPSVLMYSVEGGMRVPVNSLRVFLPGGLKGMTNFALSNSHVLPQMQMDPVFNEISMGNYKRFGNLVHKIGYVGTWGIRTVDRMVKVIGWNSVYERYYTQQTNEEIDPDRAHDFAVDQADRVTALTQPTARHQDIANIYKKSEFTRTLMMFSKQLLNYTGVAFYDIPKYMRQKGMRGRAFGYAAALSTAMVSVWIIANKRIPSTRDDLKDVALTFGALFPILGKLVTAVGRPYSGAEVPILAVPSDVLDSLLTDGWNKNAEKKILGALSGLTILGFPYGFVKKSYRASKDALQGEWGDAFAKMLSEKDWDTMAENFYGGDEEEGLVPKSLQKKKTTITVPRELRK